MRTNRLLLMADAGAGGGTGGGAGTPDWKVALPEDIRANPVFATVADVPTLAKGYLNAQQLIGKKRIALPEANATDAEKAEFYKSLGRPEAPDKYSKGKIIPAKDLNIDETSVAVARKQMFDLGLSDTQQSALMDFYFNGLNDTHGKVMQSATAARTEAETKLKTEWGDKYDSNVTVALGAVKKFATPEAMAELETGIGNNPSLVKMFHSIGLAMAEDQAGNGGTPPSDATQAGAKAKIDELMNDDKFIKAYTTTGDPGHKKAVELMTELHRKAAPGQIQG